MYVHQIYYAVMSCVQGVRGLNRRWRVSRGTTASSSMLSSNNLLKMLGSKKGLGVEVWEGFDECGDRSPASIRDASKDSKDLGDLGVLGVLDPDKLLILSGDRFPRDELSDDPLGSSAPPARLPGLFGV